MRHCERNAQSICIGVTNCYDLLLTSLAPNDGKHINLHNSGANIVHDLYPKFFLHFQKQWEDSIMMLVGTHTDIVNFKKSNNIFIQVAISLIIVSIMVC